MKLFIWDYHGTLEQGNEKAVTEISNLALYQLGYFQRLTDEACSKLYGEKWPAYFKYLLPDEYRARHSELTETALNISLENPEIIKKHIQPTLHAHYVLEEIAQSHQQIVISNTHPESLNFFLEVINVAHFFPEGYAFAAGGQSNQGRTKQDYLRDFVAGKKFDDIITIGDSPKDMELVTVAREVAGVNGVAYQYSHPGWNFKEGKLEGYTINQIRDLREVLKEI